MVNQSDVATSNNPLRSLEMGGFLLTERRHSPNSIYSSHDHKSTIIGIIYDGSCTEIIGRHSQECVPYSLQLLPAGEHHAYKFNTSSVQCLTIEIKPHRLDEIRRFSKNLDRTIYIREGMSVSAKRLYKEFRLMDSSSVLTLEGLIFGMLGDVTRSSNRRTSSVEPKWLRRAKDFIHENAREGASLIDAAVLVDVHPTYLARLFRRFYHCSLGDYARQVRLDYAVRELTKSDRSLSEIALNAGFYDQSHFTRVFKLYMRMTPSEFRISVQSGHTNTK